MLRAALIDHVRGWVGAPYHHQGRIRAGVDCIGLFLAAASELGLGDFDCEAFRQRRRAPPRGVGMLEHFDNVCGKRLQFEETAPGDLLVFWFNERTRRAQHVGLKTELGVLHTHAEVGRVAEHTIDGWWLERFICGYRVPGIE